MGKYNKIINSFSAGELSPKLIGRTDIDQYDSGLRELSNFIPSKSGGAFRRMGTRFLKELEGYQARNGSGTLIPYRSAGTQYFVFIYFSSSSNTLDQSLVDPNRPVRIYDSDGTEGTTLYVNNGATYSALDPVFADTLDPDGLRYAQYKEDLIVTHESGLLAPFVIRQTNVAGASPSFLVFPYLTNQGYFSLQKRVVRSAPFRDENILVGNDEIQLQISATGGGSPGVLVTGTPPTATLSSVNSSGTPINFFDPNMVGSLFTIDHGAPSEGVCIVTGYTDAQNVSVAILVQFSATTRSADWTESAWSDYRGFPKTVAVYQGRLHFGGNISEPQRVWVSQAGDPYTIMSRPLNQDASTNASTVGVFDLSDPINGFKKTIYLNQAADIAWMINDGDLRIGTSDGDMRIEFSNEQTSGYWRDNWNQVVQSGTNGGNFQPHLGDEKVLYVSLNGKRLRSIDSRTGDFKYRNLDLSILADHMHYAPDDNVGTAVSVNSSQFLNTVWQESLSTLWMINSRSTLIGLTVNQASNVVAWHRHSISGTNVTIKGVTSILNRDDNYDELILLIERTVDGTAELYIEKIGQEFNHSSLTNTSSDVVDKPIYLDFAKYVSQASSTTASGFAHLANESVTVWYDGKVTTATVSGAGVITLPAAATQIIAGYPYKSRIESLTIEAGQQFGASRGNVSRIDRAVVTLYNSSAGLMGHEDGNLNDIEIEADELYTGDVEIDFAQSAGIEPKFIIETESALPLNVLSVTLRGVAYDG